MEQRGFHFVESLKPLREEPSVLPDRTFRETDIAQGQLELHSDSSARERATSTIEGMPKKKMLNQK